MGWGAGQGGAPRCAAGRGRAADESQRSAPMNERISPGPGGPWPAAPGRCPGPVPCLGPSCGPSAAPPVTCGEPPDLYQCMTSSAFLSPSLQGRAAPAPGGRQSPGTQPPTQSQVSSAGTGGWAVSGVSFASAGQVAGASSAPPAPSIGGLPLAQPLLYICHSPLQPSWGGMTSAVSQMSALGLGEGR